MSYTTDRIESNPEDYKRIKEISKTDMTFVPYRKWYERKRQRPLDHVRAVRVELEKIRNRNKRLNYDDIAKMAGCSKRTISKLLGKKPDCSKDMSDRILTNLHNAEC